MSDTATTPSTTGTKTPLHPEAVKLPASLASLLGQFNTIKMQIEYLMNSAKSKGLVPIDAELNLPDTMGVVEDMIGGPISRDPDTGATIGSNYSAKDYAHVLVALDALAAASDAPIFPSGPTIREALERFART